MTTIAYFISFRTYATWLHGDERGSVDTDHNRYGDQFLGPNPNRMAFEQSLLKNPPAELDEQRRFVVDATIRAVCAYRQWDLHALHVRLTHVHSVVSAPVAPERVMNAFKSWSTRRLTESGVLPAGLKVWSRHGSTKYIHTAETLARAVCYTLEEQGPPLPMIRPAGWRDEWSAGARPKAPP